MLYDEQDLMNTMEKIEVLNYHQEIEHNGIKFWCYNAGHVLGAAMFMLQIAGVKVITHKTLCCSNTNIDPLHWRLFKTGRSTSHGS